MKKNPNEDGYSICDEFLKKYSYIKDSIAEKADSSFTGNLIDKYFNLCYVFDNRPENNHMGICIQSCDCPIWVLTEIIGFNSLIKFIRFYNEKYPNSININTAVLNPVRSLRNACAHNNCLLNDLHPQNTRPPELISNFVKKIPDIKKDERKKKLKCRPLFEFTCLIYLHKKVVPESVRTQRIKELREFVDSLGTNILIISRKTDLSALH